MLLSAEWDKLESVRKQKWLRIANRFPSMKPNKRKRAQQRIVDWITTPEQRRAARENYVHAKKIDPGQKSAQSERYKRLLEEQKKKLAANAAMKTQVANMPSNPQSKAKAVSPMKSVFAPPLTAQVEVPVPLHRPQQLP